MSWDRVRRWLDELPWPEVASVRDGMAEAANVQGEPYDTAAIVIARTVETAPIEWCAMLLGHGTRVVLKYPSGLPGIAPRLVRAAEQVGLPLTATDDRSVLQGVDLVIAMGSDETMDALRQELPESTVAHLFGHRFSAAWLADPADVAEALWPHDSRGCMSPQVVFTSSPLALAVAEIAEGMQIAEGRHPRGEIGEAEGAAIRARGALAKIVGVERHGEGWAVHGLTARHWHPEALPRCVAVVQVRDRAEARAILEPWARWLSTVGDDSGEPWFDARVCPVAEMQNPPLDRLHDGVHTLTAVVRQA